MLGDGLRQRVGAGGDEGAGIDVLEEELHRRELALAGIAHRPRGTGVDDEVGVAGGVDERPGPHRLRPALGGDDDGVEAVAVAHHVGDQRVQEQRDGRLLGDQPVEQALGRPRHVEEHGAALERHRSGCGPRGLEGVGHLLGDAARDVVEAAVGRHVQPADRADRRGREVAAEKPVMFEQADAGALAGSGEGGAQAGGAAPCHADVHVRDDRGVPGRNAHFHACGR